MKVILVGGVFLFLLRDLFRICTCNVLIDVTGNEAILWASDLVSRIKFFILELVGFETVNLLDNSI